MTAPGDDDPLVDQEYDEEADSDFNDEDVNDNEISSSEDGEHDWSTRVKKGHTKQSAESKAPLIEELDSGDEQTIKERKGKRRHKTKADKDAASDEEDEGWRAKTRTMRAQEKEEKRQRKLVNVKASTIDVDKLWEEMNRPGPLPPVRVEEDGEAISNQKIDAAMTAIEDKENRPLAEVEEMVTIKRRFKFAGEIHTEEKVVPKSSAEARLWLAQQEGKDQTPTPDATGRQRPLRKISRFDPNYNNMDAFRKTWLKPSGEDQFQGPKLNVVEKSKMDWAVHVDSEGLKDELDEHAKAKDAYLNRMDFLGQVEQRREEEARAARLKG